MQSWDLTSVEAAEPHEPQILASAEDARTIVLQLPAGEELQEHEVHEHAWLHIHDGAVSVTDEGGEAREAGAGALVHWKPQERHTVRATQDALLLLMLAPWPGPGHPNLRND